MDGVAVDRAVCPGRPGVWGRPVWGVPVHGPGKAGHVLGRGGGCAWNIARPGWCNAGTLVSASRVEVAGWPESGVASRIGGEVMLASWCSWPECPRGPDACRRSMSQACFSDFAVLCTHLSDRCPMSMVRGAGRSSPMVGHPPGPRTARGAPGAGVDMASACGARTARTARTAEARSTRRDLAVDRGRRYLQPGLDLSRPGGSMMPRLGLGSG